MKVFQVFYNFALDNLDLFSLWILTKKNYPANNFPLNGSFVDYVSVMDIYSIYINILTLILVEKQ